MTSLLISLVIQQATMKSRASCWEMVLFSYF